jgi:hypothetical protein
VGSSTHLMQVPDVGSAYTLIDRGGVVALLLLGIVFLFLAFQFGWIVPGYMYKERKDGETAWKTQCQGTLEAFKELSAELRAERIAASQPNPARRSR